MMNHGLQLPYDIIPTIKLHPSLVNLISGKLPVPKCTPDIHEWGEVSSLIYLGGSMVAFSRAPQRRPLSKMEKKGSLGEEELVQMVRDFIELDSSSSPISLATTKPNSINHAMSLQEILGKMTDDENEVLQQVLDCVENRGFAGETTSNMNLKKKLIVSKLKSRNYEASLCQSSWATSPKSNYEYIDVITKNNGRLIVDIDFRSQFELARPTAVYRELLGKVPSIYVGSEEKLHKLIPLLCSAAKLSLKESGLHIPPWRRESYVHLKWLPVSPKSSAELTPDLVESESQRHRSSTHIRDGGGAGGSGLSRRFSKMGINCC